MANEKYDGVFPIPDKFLEPDGSTKTLSEILGVSGGGTVENVTNVTSTELDAGGLADGLYFATDSGELAYSSGGVMTVFASKADLQAHETADEQMYAQWNQSLTAQNNALQSQILALQAGIQNKKLDTTQTIDIETASAGAGYTVGDTLGGQITFNAFNVLVGTGTLYINGSQVWSNAGLTLAIGASGSTMDVNKGDVITQTGMTSITYTPYEAA